jgi:hypothetical protein
MAAVENLTKNESVDVGNNQSSTFRDKLVGMLASIPEPAAQSAALQLLKTKVTFDKSLVFFMGTMAMIVVEELL